jgi:hypothetical protein
MGCIPIKQQADGALLRNRLPANAAHLFKSAATFQSTSQGS